jgi:hypothetical protein
MSKLTTYSIDDCNTFIKQYKEMIEANTSVKNINNYIFINPYTKRIIRKKKIIDDINKSCIDLLDKNPEKSIKLLKKNKNAYNDTYKYLNDTSTLYQTNQKLHTIIKNLFNTETNAFSEENINMNKNVTLFENTDTIKQLINSIILYKKSID